MNSALDVGVGAVYSICGALLIGYGGRRIRASGIVMVVTGLCWFIGTLWTALALLHRGPLTQLLIGYPTGRLRGWVPVSCVCLGYVDMLPSVGGNPAATVAVSTATIMAVGLGYRRAPGVERQDRAVSTAVTLIVEGVLGAAALVRIAGGALDPIVLPSYQLGLIVAAAVLVAQGIWGRGGSVSDVSVELGNREGGTVQDRLARVLGDPTLRLAAIDRFGHGLTDESGEPVEFPADPGPGRTRTPVPSSGPAVALLDHETGALADPALVGPVTALIRVAVDNARTQIDIAHRMAELEKSRRALVRAVDTERRLLEGDLRGGALESLACAADVLRTLPDDPDAPNSQIAELLRRAAESVSEFARGVHPRILDAKGLPDALGELAGRCPIPVTVQVPQVRLPLDLELTLYFVASEALTNVVKHAEASIATIHLTASAGQVRMEVSDDGAGGANPDRGSGLLGLADRLAVLGGTLSVTSKPGAGSAVVATLPRVPPAVVNGSN